VAAQDGDRPQVGKSGGGPRRAWLLAILVKFLAFTAVGFSTAETPVPSPSFDKLQRHQGFSASPHISCCESFLMYVKLRRRSRLTGGGGSLAAANGETAGPAGANAIAHTGIVHVGIFDFTGAFREKRIDIAAFNAALGRGWRFIDALPFWMHDERCFAEKGFADETVSIDADSIRPYPFEPAAALAVADYAGASAAVSPRSTLQRIVAKAAGLGFEALAGFEFETIFLAEDGASLRRKGWSDLNPALPHNRCWSGVAAAADAGFLTDVHEQLRAAGINLDHHCMELGPGCAEYCLGPDPIVKAADDAALFKVFTKAIARRHGMTASFLAQLDAGFPGLGGHITLSLRGKDGAPVFSDTNDPQGLSATAKSFIGGVLALTPELMCMFAPTINAYRRLRPGNWAPRAANWGFGNYSCAIRAVAHTPETTRLEFRLPGADMVPHVAAAMMLGAGLWGIEHEIDPGPPVTGNGRLAESAPGAELPTSLEEAARRFARSDAARALFGTPFVDHYAAWCAAEAAAFHAHVSAFERARYLETV
jgi:glutamine synthetase